MSDVPSYEAYRNRRKKKPPSVLGAFALAAFMLLAVFLISPLVRLVEEREQAVVRTEEVENEEPPPAPELPALDETMETAEPDAVPQWEEAPGETGVVVGRVDADIRVESGAAALADPIGEIARMPASRASGIVGAGELDHPVEPLDSAGLRVLTGDAGGSGLDFVIIVDPTGNASIEETLSGDVAENAEIAKVVSGMRFTPPRVNGKPVTVRVWITVEPE